MSAFLYGTALQWKLDMRSKTLLITCYVVPLLFFAFMGGIFTAVIPEMKQSLTQSMTIMGITMGAVIGLPPTLTEIYGSDLKKAYKANGISLPCCLLSILISTFVHLMILSVILYVLSPLLFDAAVPENPFSYFGGLAVFIIASLSIGAVLGLTVKSQANLTMFSQLIFLPSIMLSGIMFPKEMLPEVFVAAGCVFPASWGFRLLSDGGFSLENLWPLAAVFLIMSVLCGILLKKRSNG